MEKFNFYTGEENSKVLCRSIGLTYNHSTMDMSVANSSQRQRMIILTGVKKFPIESENWCGCGKTQINEVTDQYVDLTWRGRNYKAFLRDSLQTGTVYLDNPYLSREEVSMVYEYSEVDALKGAIGLFNDTRIEHKESPSTIGSNYDEDARHYVLTLLMYAIENGYKMLYPSYALLSACRNWSSLTITDMPTFVRLMQQGIKKGCFTGDNTTGFDNLAEILTFNKMEDLFENVVGLKKIVEQAAERGVEMASWILEGVFEYHEMTACENPDKKESVLMIHTYIEGEQRREDYHIYVEEQIKPNTTLDLGCGITAHIGEVGKDWLNFTWDEEERLEHNFYCYKTEPKVIEGNTKAYLEIKFDKRNLWTAFKILMNHIDFDLVSSNPDNKYCIEGEKRCALELIDLLIERGDTHLEELKGIMLENEDWTIFGLDGEYEYWLK